MYRNRHGELYYLHARVIELKNGRQQTIRYFRKTIDEAHRLMSAPLGFEISETQTGMPVLRRVQLEAREP